MRPSKRATVLAGAAAALLRKGVVLGADSWAYWEGSVSLLERGQYTYFGGVSIFVFPPLFSCVLALFQAVLGISARSLAVALASCVAAGSAAWLLVYLLLTGRRERVSLPDLLAVLYVPASLAITAQTCFPKRFGSSSCRACCSW
jgi:hypothetical protein